MLYINRVLLVLVTMFILVSCGTNYIKDDGPNKWSYYTPGGGPRWYTIKVNRNEFVVIKSGNYTNDNTSFAEAEGWLLSQGCAIVSRNRSFVGNEETIIVSKECFPKGDR